MEINRFEDYLGQDHIKSHFIEAARHDRAGHAYILSGQKGMGKETIARLFGISLLCENDGDKPCGHCRSCKLALSGSHPDLIRIDHEKPGVISVDEIRSHLVSDIRIKPYYGKKKIYIIPDAQKMNTQAQNSLLKSIEEPPSYAVILILTESYEAMLQTVRSRCIHFSLNPLPDNVVCDHLIKYSGLNETDCAVCAAFAGGNLGMAMENANSETFRDELNKTLDLLKNAKDLSISEIFAFAKETASRKDKIPEILDIILLMYRDILVCKACGRDASLTFINEREYIESKALHTTYEDINNVINSIDDLKGRLNLNANAETGMDVLLIDVAR